MNNKSFISDKCHVQLILFVIIVIANTLSLRGQCQSTNWDYELEQGVKNFQNANFKDALVHLDKIANAIPTLGIDDQNAGMIYFMCGTCSSQLGQVENSIKYNNFALKLPTLPQELTIQLLGSQLDNYNILGLYANCNSIINRMMNLYDVNKTIDIVQFLIVYYVEHQQYNEAVKFEKELSDIIVPPAQNEIDRVTNKKEWNTIYMGLAHAFTELKEYDKALNYYSKSLETVTEYNKDTRSVIYSSIAKIFEIKGDKQSAIKYKKLAIETDKTLLRRIAVSIGNKTSERETRYKADQLLNLGVLYTKNGQYEKSIDCLEKADSLYLSIKDVNYHAYTLTYLYHALHVLGKYKLYSKIRDELNLLLTEQKITNNEIFIIVSGQQGRFYEDDGNFDMAIDAYLANLQAALNFYGEGNTKLFPCYYELASLYLEKKDLSKASEYINILKSLFTAKQANTEDLYLLLFLECELLNELGQIGSAMSLLEEIASQVESENVNPEIKEMLCSNLGTLYAVIGDNDQALKYSELAVKQCGLTSGQESNNYAYALLNLSEIYALVGNNEKALELTIDASEIIKRLLGENHPRYYTCLMKLASRYLVIDKEESKRIRLECLTLSRQLFGESSSQYADNLIYSVELTLTPTDEDIESLRNALEIKRECGKDGDSFYLHGLNWYALLLQLHRDWSDLYDASSELLDCCRKYVAHNFLKLSGMQRELLWNSVKGALSGIEIHATAYSQYAVESNDYKFVKEFGCLAYDVRLLKKGLLLTAAQNLKELIANNNDSIINEIQRQIRTLQQQLDEQSVGDDENIRIGRTISNLERDMIEIVSPKGDFTDFMSIKWQDIQSALKPGEVAVEFFSFPAQDKVQYGAVWVTPTASPLACTLFCEDELDKYMIGGESIYDYSNPGMYKTIWSVLETFSDISSSNTIYFSADNILNTISIENLVDSEGILASEKHRLYRLSSTRELISRNKNTPKDYSVILYGGLNYDATVDELRLANQHYAIATDVPNLHCSGTRTLRNRADYLSWSLSEVKSISSLMRSSNVELISGTNGTEESFKCLPIKAPSILHIATHGFYYEPEDIQDKLMSNPTNYKFLRYDDMDKVSTETLAMRGSGLLLSGANLTLTGRNIPENLSDGILTAEELARINLKSVDLAVLSACETGLGATSEEGVFGLQRGFKLAGVNSLLMSLWKVDDKATSLLMQCFYRNLIQGMSKEESLKSACGNLRKSKDYSHPDYWAGFILLDALN